MVGYDPLRGGIARCRATHPPTLVIPRLRNNQRKTLSGHVTRFFFTSEVAYLHRKKCCLSSAVGAFEPPCSIVPKDRQAGWAVVHDAGNRFHDRWTGYDTTSQRFRSAPKIEFDDAVGYEKTSRRRFLTVIRDANIRVPSEYTFIDLGCGKGNVLVLAAQYGFRSIIGVEVDPDLASIARRNVDRFTSRRRHAAKAQVLESDVVQFGLPLIREASFTCTTRSVRRR